MINKSPLSNYVPLFRTMMLILSHVYHFQHLAVKAVNPSLGATNNLYTLLDGNLWFLNYKGLSDPV